MRVTTNGQVTIPIQIRRAMRLVPGSEVRFRIEGDRVVLERAPEDRTYGTRVVDAIAGRYRTTMGTDELMALTRGDD